MGKKHIRKNSLILVVSAIILSMVTSCDAKPSDVPVSSININTVSTSETSDPSVSVPDKVITTGIDVIDMEDNTKQIKVYVDEREIDGVLYLPEGTGPFPVCYIAQGLGAPYYAYIDIAEAMAANGIAAVLIKAKDMIIKTRSAFHGQCHLAISGIRISPETIMVFLQAFYLMHDDVDDEIDRLTITDGTHQHIGDGFVTRQSVECQNPA